MPFYKDMSVRKSCLESRTHDEARISSTIHIHLEVSHGESHLAKEPLLVLEELQTCRSFAAMNLLLEMSCCWKHGWVRVSYITLRLEAVKPFGHRIFMRWQRQNVAQQFCIQWRGASSCDRPINLGGSACSSLCPTLCSPHPVAA